MKPGARMVGWALLCLAVSCSAVWAQDIPDAPSATRPAPAQQEQLPSAPEPQNGAPPTANRPAQPSPRVAPAPPNQAPPPPASDSRNALETFRKTVNFVLVPVTVKDPSGRLVSGLVRDDFTLYENGVEQQLKLFTSDPFPLSAAIILDVNMPAPTIRKIQDGMSALTGAFSQFDELAFYTFGNTVERRVDFSGVSDSLSLTLKRTNPKGRPAGVPVVGGPMGQSSPTVNGEPIDPSIPHVPNVPREVHVLNDAILRAALDLGKRDAARRRIIFVISDGREYGSTASYADVLKVLLSDNIMVYAVAVDDAALPVYKSIEKIHLPRAGYGNLLPKYASATGGEVFPELTSQAIESAYSRLTSDARNQYTLGYTARQTPSNSYRSIEVVVHRPDLVVRAKDGYYPLPISAP